MNGTARHARISFASFALKKVFALYGIFLAAGGRNGRKAAAVTLAA
ncbi:MAG: hypothetical protein ACRDP7_11615 [Trebonia sp.]